LPCQVPLITLSVAIGPDVEGGLSRSLSQSRLKGFLASLEGETLPSGWRSSLQHSTPELLSYSVLRLMVAPSLSQYWTEMSALEATARLATRLLLAFKRYWPTSTLIGQNLYLLDEEQVNALQATRLHI
jgi:hypothetical protein